MSKKRQIGIVTATFNTEITSKLREGALHAIEKAGGAFEVWSVDVPGAVEIPLACQMLLDKGCEGVVALGAVIRGDTPHFEYVCLSVERAMTTMILDYKKPIGFGVLTVNTYEQALERVGGKHGNKGEEAADAVLAMMELKKKIKKAKSAKALSDLWSKNAAGSKAIPQSALVKKAKRSVQ